MWFEEEPVVNHKLFELDQIITTSHLGRNTVEAQENVVINVSQDIARILTGDIAKNPVNIPSVLQDI